MADKNGKELTAENQKGIKIESEKEFKASYGKDFTLEITFNLKGTK